MRLEGDGIVNRKSFEAKQIPRSAITRHFVFLNLKNYVAIPNYSKYSEGVDYPLLLISKAVESAVSSGFFI